MNSNRVAFTMVLLVVFFGISQAGPSDILNGMKAKYINKPSNESDEQKFIEPYDEDYYFYKGDYCLAPKGFKINNLAMKLVYRFVKASEVGNLGIQYDCQFHVVKVDYEIMCSNGLVYKGVEHLFSPSKIENNILDQVRGDRMAGEEYKYWIEISPEEYIKTDGTITKDAKHGEWRHYTIAKMDTNSILAKWDGQKISSPKHKFMGIPGKLPRPVLLIHGLGGTYEDWGVNPKYDKFSEGKVEARGYKNGSLPDILARSNNLNDTSEAEINSNGIYFFQAHRKLIDKKWTSDSLDWEADNSQSKDLANKITSVMDSFYYKLKVDWKDCDDCQIDLIGHSQGGLVIREMLRNLSRDPFSTNAVAANHIRRIITLNTPHFGSALTGSASEAAQKGYKGLEFIIDGLNDTITKHKLFDTKVNLSSVVANAAVGAAAGFAGGFYDGWNAVDPESDLEYAGAFFVGVLGAIPSAIYGTDFRVVAKGPYLGPYDFDVKLEQLWSDKTFSPMKNRDLIKSHKERMLFERKYGEHLYENSNFMKKLNAGNDIFPYLPNGSKPVLLPMYSDSASKAIPMLFSLASIEANRICAEQKNDAEGCLAVNAVLNGYTKELSKGLLSLSKSTFNDSLWHAVVDMQKSWLAQSDGVVEVNSQKFIRGNNSPHNADLRGYFLEPRPYAIHDAQSPLEAVLHGPVSTLKNSGATQQGFDLLCALSAACDEAFTFARQKGRSAIIHLSEDILKGEFNEKSVEVVGNFKLAPPYISSGTQALSLSTNGETILTAGYEPGEGSFITLGGTAMQPAPPPGIMPLAKAMASVGQTELLIGPEIATQPFISRKGDSVYVSFMNYSGKAFKKGYSLPGLPDNLTVSVIAEKDAEISPVIIGDAIATNPETQKPPPPPPGHPLAPITLAVLHREARGEHENNTSRPRLLIYNATKDTLEFSKVAYYFTADPARVPKVEIDYPNIPVSLEHLGGDQWRFVLEAGNQKVAPKSFYPSTDGWQIRLHYSDWYKYEHLNDWSADYSLGLAKFNSKIVIYNKDEKIVWGNEAPEFESEESEGIDATLELAGTLSWNDDSPWEMNVFKPRVTVKNIGSAPLSNYHAQLWFRVPQGKNLSPLEVWYAPESSQSVKNVSSRVWMLDVHFNKHILYPDDSVSEGNIGLRLADWSNFDKTVCGIVLKDEKGNILFGKEPSVAECESYNEQSLQLIYTKRE